jgi:hypothetical protein
MSTCVKLIMHDINISCALTPSTPAPTAFSHLRHRPSSVAEQISTLSPAGERLAIEDLPRIILKGKRYVQESWIDKRANAKRYSWIGNHGSYLVEMKENHKLGTFWSCNECDRLGGSQLYDTGTTSNAERHLWSKHGIKKLSGANEVPASPNVIAMQILGCKRRKINDVPTTADASNLFKDTLVRWMVKANIPLIGPEDQEFRNLIEIASLGSNNLVNLIPTGDTLRTWIIKEFEERKIEIRTQLLHRAQSKIHLSFDLWTSEGTTMSLMAVVAHFLDTAFVNRTRLIALRRLYGSHSGENMARVLIDVIQEFRITDRLGYFMIDNAESNDTCLEHLVREMVPEATEEDVEERRLRCWGHVLNLVARAFLFGTDADAFELEDAANTVLERELERLSAWRKKGPVGKLHNTTAFIRSSTQRKELFKSISLSTIDEVDGFLVGNEANHLGVIKDNSTRWNSTYLMITRALTKKQEIDAFIQVLDARKGDKGLPQEDRLSNEDWLILTKTADILKPIYDHTMRFQSRAKEGHHGAIWEVLPSMEMILHHLESLKSEYSVASSSDVHYGPQGLTSRQLVAEGTSPPNGIETETTVAQNTRRVAERRPIGYLPTSRRPGQPQSQLSGFTSLVSQRVCAEDGLSDASQRYLCTCINNAWSKLDKYYNRTDRSRAYFGSVRMHPALNAAWFAENWKEDDQLEWLESAEMQLRDHYDKYYRDPGIHTPYPGPPSTADPTYEPDDFDDFLAPASFYAQAPVVDEYDRYRSLNPIRDAFRRPLDWWKDHLDEYPTISRMALDFFSIPAMSTECERVFSLAKIALTTQRQHMNEGTLEALICLKRWWKDDAFD